MEQTGEERLEELVNERPDYEPVEGIDYIVDLYALCGVVPDATADQIQTAIKGKLFEYHPDRMQGLAPEFIERGEITTRLLNRARHVLLDEERRKEYDLILNNWTGPKSDSGIPAISFKRYIQATSLLMTSEQLEADIKAKKQQAELFTGYRPGRIAMLEAVSGQLEESASAVIAEELEDALRQQDLILSFEEGLRLEIIGVDTKERGHRISLGYKDKVSAELETAKKDHEAENVRRSADSVTEQLALLAGENVTNASSAVAAVTAMDSLYGGRFDAQAERLLEIAESREQVLKKRLEIFAPSFPLPELQAEPKPKLILGIYAPQRTFWFGFTYGYDNDTKNARADSFDLDSELLELLNSESYAEVIAKGFNVCTIKVMEDVDIKILINTAIEKYLRRYKLVPETD